MVDITLALIGAGVSATPEVAPSRLERYDQARAHAAEAIAELARLAMPWQKRGGAHNCDT